MLLPKLKYITPKKVWNTLLLGISFLLNSAKVRRRCQPMFLSVETSAVCNLKCPQCAAGMGLINRKHFMDLDLLKQIVDECADSLLHLQLYFQGEPLLNKDITKMVAYAHERGIYTTISTNGQVISQKLAKELVEAGLDHIIISIDGVQQESYEKYRVGGCIDKAIHAVGLLHAAKKQARSPLKVEVQMVVFRHNEDEVPTMKHKGYEWGADLVSIKTAQIYNFEHHPESIPTNKKYSRYIVRNGKWVLKKRLRNRCWRSWSGAVMDSNGTILACCFDKCEKYAYGNVKDTRLREIWNGEKASTFRECIRKNRKGIDICNNCTE